MKNNCVCSIIISKYQNENSLKTNTITEVINQLYIKTQSENSLAYKMISKHI